MCTLDELNKDLDATNENLEKAEKTAGKNSEVRDILFGTFKTNASKPCVLCAPANNTNLRNPTSKGFIP